MKGPHPGVRAISKSKDYTIYVRLVHKNETHSFSGDLDSIYSRLLQSFPNMLITRSNLHKSLKVGMNLFIQDKDGNVIGGIT